MTDREKLVELLEESTYEALGGNLVVRYFATAKEFADHLIANGVTVREWIPVEDRLPDMHKDVLMHFEHNMAVGHLYDVDEGCTFWRAKTDDGWEADCDCEPTHWMPLPEPLKEESHADAT